MSPRPYNLGQRQLTTDQTRSRIVAAARELLASDAGTTGFTVDAVAKQAGVSRMTVYYQFKSKRGVLEALFDDLANRGLMPYLRPVFAEPDPARQLEGLIEAFGKFWDSDRLVIRRARALAALDPEVAESVQARDELRREHIRKILTPIIKTSNRAYATAVQTVHMLTSFETFDTFLSIPYDLDRVTDIVCQLAAAVVDPPPSRPFRTR